MTFSRFVSVVIPAYNAEATIEATLRSLQVQTSSQWEAVVVDDGSIDATAAVVEDFARLDDRIRLVRRPNGGVSAARNTGLTHAHHPWVVFLDSDDLFSPYFLERSMDALQAHPTADGANGTWVRMLPDGRLFDESPAESYGDLFDVAARYCPFAIHSCVIRRDLVLDVGGFDESLRICEDWDLWARIARAGAHLVAVTNATAIYRSRPDSASFDGHRMFEDGLVVLNRTHSADPRVVRPLHRAAKGRRSTDLDETVLNLSAWCAGLVIGKGGDASNIFEGLPVRAVPTLSPEGIASVLWRSDSVGALGEPLWQRWSTVQKSFLTYLEQLELVSGAPGLAARVELQLGRLSADEVRSPDPVRLGTILVCPVEARSVIESIDVPDGVDRVRLRIELDRVTVGHAELASVDAVVASDRVVDVVSEQIWWELLDRSLITPRRRRRRLVRTSMWTTFLDQALGSGSRRTIDASNGSCTVELSTGVRQIRSVADEVTVTATLGGRPVVVLRLRPRNGRISGRALAATVVRHAGADLGRAAVREAVLGHPDDGRPLGDRLRRAAERPVTEHRRSVPTRHLQVDVVPAWSLTLRKLMPDVRGRLRATGRGLPPRRKRLAKRVLTPLRFLPTLAARLAPGASRVAIPVLMYHRVAPAGSGSTRQWRVTPPVFGQHMRALANAGYTGISLDDLRRGLYEGADLPERPVVLTFDDGYQDFADHALPALQKHQFSSTVFVVTERVGGSNTWDDVFEDPAPLMDWPTLGRLVDAGVEIGSHSAHHQALTSLPISDVRDELVGSGDTITQRLGVPVRSLAYPYGDVDRAVADTAEDAGYALAVTCDWGSVTPSSDPHLLPRVEVTGTMSARDLIHRIRRTGA